jgi:hypothetical protein
VSSSNEIYCPRRHGDANLFVSFLGEDELVIDVFDMQIVRARAHLKILLRLPLQDLVALGQVVASFSLGLSVNPDEQPELRQPEGFEDR